MYDIIFLNLSQLGTAFFDRPGIQRRIHFLESCIFRFLYFQNSWRQCGKHPILRHGLISLCYPYAQYTSVEKCFVCFVYAVCVQICALCAV